MWKITEIMQDEQNIKIMAEEIKNAFVEKANSENVDYSFSTSLGKIENDKANTYFVFDPSPETKLYEFKKAMFDEELNGIKADSEEEKEIMTKIQIFVTQVCKEMTFLYKEELEEVIRRVVFGGKSTKETIPLKTIDVLMMDISDYDSVPNCAKYLLRVFKEDRTEIDVDDITVFIQDREEETGMTPHEVFLMEKQIGNPMFKNVTDVQLGKKFLHDVTLYLFVDYSFKTETMDASSLEIDIADCDRNNLESFCKDYLGEDFRDISSRPDKIAKKAVQAFIDNIGDVFSKNLSFSEAFKVSKLSEFLSQREKIEKNVKELKNILASRRK